MDKRLTVSKIMTLILLAVVLLACGVILAIPSQQKTVRAAAATSDWDMLRMDEKEYFEGFMEKDYFTHNGVQYPIKDYPSLHGGSTWSTPMLALDKGIFKTKICIIYGITIKGKINYWRQVKIKVKKPHFWIKFLKQAFIFLRTSGRRWL